VKKNHGWGTVSEGGKKVGWFVNKNSCGVKEAEKKSSLTGEDWELELLYIAEGRENEGRGKKKKKKRTGTYAKRIKRMENRTFKLGEEDGGRIGEGAEPYGGTKYREKECRTR